MLWSEYAGFMTDHGSLFATAAIALYAAHHVGDYWVQTDTDAHDKGKPGQAGARACTRHVLTYVLAQAMFLYIAVLVTGVDDSQGWKWLTALAVSGVTHWTADRREHGLMFWLARKIPGKANFLVLGAPREPRVIEAWFDCPSCEGRGAGGPGSDESTNGKCWDCRGGGKLPSALTIDDNPTLGTGAWALDQSWHIFWGVFVAALIIAA
jgi:hypothetical protein